jgi:hypothetical protein
MATISPISSTFSAFSPANSSPLTGKMNVLFGLAVAYCAAGAAYVLYNFYQAYQFSTHSSFGLSEKLKLIKCEALLLKAAEKKASEDVQPLLQQCEALLDSIIIDRSHSDPLTDAVDCFRIHDKERLLVKLAQYYAERDPARAWSIAEHLTSSDNIFDVAESIRKHHPTWKLVPLYQLADEAREKEAISIALTGSTTVNTMDDIAWSLKLAKIYFGKELIHRASVHLEKAQNLALTIENPLDQLIAHCSIAELCTEVQTQINRNSSIAAAKELIPKMPIEDLVQARLILAETYLQYKKFNDMDQELSNVVKLLQEEPATHKDLVTYVRFIKKNQEHFVSSFRDSQIKDLIDQVLNYTSKLVGKNKVEAYLNLSSLYLEELAEYPASKEDLRSEVASLIGAMPESSETEISSKIDSWCRHIYFYKQDPDGAHSIIYTLERLYEQCPLKTASQENWSRAQLGQRIVALYEQMGLADEPFFQRYLLDIVLQRDKDTSCKVTELSMTGFPSIYSKQQNKSKLVAAESLLPQLSNREWSTAQAEIAKGYLRVDPQKSLDILADLENDQAKSCLIKAAVTGVGLAALHFCPLASPVIFLGVGAYTWHTW